LGVQSNLEFLLTLVAEQRFVAGEVDTQLVQREYSSWRPPRAHTEVLADRTDQAPRLSPASAAALLTLALSRSEPATAGGATSVNSPPAATPWSILGGFRTGES